MRAATGIPAVVPLLIPVENTVEDPVPAAPPSPAPVTDGPFAPPPVPSPSEAAFGYAAPVGGSEPVARPQTVPLEAFAAWSEGSAEADPVGRHVPVDPSQAGAATEEAPSLSEIEMSERLAAAADYRDEVFAPPSEPGPWVEPDSEPAAASEREPEPWVEPEPEPAAASEREPEPEPERWVEPEPGPEPSVEPEPEPDLEPEPSVEPEPEPAPLERSRW